MNVIDDSPESLVDLFPGESIDFVCHSFFESVQKVFDTDSKLANDNYRAIFLMTCLEQIVNDSCMILAKVSGRSIIQVKTELLEILDLRKMSKGDLH